MSKHINEYHKSVSDAYELGNVESSYNTPIITLLSHFGCIARDMSGSRSGATGENIDIQLWYETDNPSETKAFAGVEVKKVGGIDERAKTQVKTATQLFGNVILTDNFTWWFYHLYNGQVDFYSGVELIINDNGVLKLQKDNVDLFESLINGFMLKDPTTIKSSVKLAEYMAAHARTIRNVIKGILKEDENKQPLINDSQRQLQMFDEIVGLYIKIKDDLRPYLETSSFADMYAQTIVYGLFIARYNDNNPERFSRGSAIENLRSESALLKMFFNHIATTDRPHPTLESEINKLCNLYRNTDVVMLLDKDDEKDTIIHFYEEFLSYYDPALRKSLGVFYTPHQVVRYMVRMVDKLLIEEFGIEDGLKNNDVLEIDVPSTPYMDGKKEKHSMKVDVPRVSILDPACGTGTFHAEIIKFVKDKYFSGGKEAFWNAYILEKNNSLASRLIGFEIMMTSYVVAQLKIRRTIHETLTDTISKNDIPHSKIYLTNTLAPPQSTLEDSGVQNLFTINDFTGAVTEEAKKADTWKSRRPIKVIIGNPPYLAASTTPYDISAYKTETDGITDFKERKHWLNDDYVKFFRFAEQIIGKEKEGILAFVSNNGFLDNNTFRGMRASLLRTFKKIYIVDLHGNAVKSEVSPDGSKDENIFDIMQGISLFIGIKKNESDKWANVFHNDLWGRRKNKLSLLNEGAISFKELSIYEKMAYFIPYDIENKSNYERGISIVDLFPAFVTGVLSGNDKVAISQNKEQITERISIVSNAIDDTPILNIWKKFSRGQSAESIKNDVISGEGLVTPINFRPFDDRWTYYSGKSCGWLLWPRDKQTMWHLLNSAKCPIENNIGLVFAKATSQRFEWDAIFISDKIIDSHYIDYPANSIAYISPLYLRMNNSDSKWRPNFNNELFIKLTEYLVEEPTPLEIFDYIYGILHDPVYRERFGEYLRRSFPRVPIISSLEDKVDPNAFYVSEDMFKSYVTAGGRLRKLHLMQEKVPAVLIMEPNTPDDLEVGAIKYRESVLQINSKKSILGIPEDVWNYRIGGYQVLDKWFKSHKGEALNIDKFSHIENVVGLLAETIKIQAELKAMH